MKLRAVFWIVPLLIAPAGRAQAGLVQSGQAQQSAPVDSASIPPLPELLDRLYGYTEQYRAKLPSLECHEQILSEEVDYKGKVTQKVRVEGTLREIRKSPPVPADPFRESHVLATPKRGRAIDLGELPYFIQGGFANLVAFHNGRLRDCFDYRVSPANNPLNIEVLMDRNGNSSDEICWTIIPGTHYRVIADLATGRVLHSERTIPDQEAIERNEAYFAAMDYAPWGFGDQTFWVPSRFEAHSATETGRMEATYTNCHRFAGEMRIVPDSEIPDTNKPQ